MITGIYQAKSGIKPSCHGFLELTFPQSQSKENFYLSIKPYKTGLLENHELHALFCSYFLAEYPEKALVVMYSIRFTAVHGTSVRIADEAFEVLACGCGH